VPSCECSISRLSATQMHFPLRCAGSTTGVSETVECSMSALPCWQLLRIDGNRSVTRSRLSATVDSHHTLVKEIFLILGDQPSMRGSVQPCRYAAAVVYADL